MGFWPASLLCTCRRARVRVCLGPRVHARTCVQCSAAPCDMLGWEPCGFPDAYPVVLGPSGPEKPEAGCDDPAQDAGALLGRRPPLSLTQGGSKKRDSRVSKGQTLQRPRPPLPPHPLSPPPQPPSERTLWISPGWESPRKGFCIRTLQLRLPLSGKRSPQASPLHIK